MNFLAQHWPHIAAFLGGGAALRYLVYISKVMPPLPAGAGWW